MSITTLTPPIASPELRLPAHRIDPLVLADIADHALDVDRTTTDLRPRLRQLAARGRTDLGLPGSSGPLAEQVAVIERIAQDCVTTAFAVWAHRMATHYLVTADSRHHPFAGTLRRGERPGVSAMAAAIRDVNGLAPVPVRYRIGGDTIVLNGPINWASNLHDDSVIITAARHADSVATDRSNRIVVAIPADTPGVARRDADGLVALNSSRSGSVTFTDVRVGTDHLVTDDLDGFLSIVQPTFLTLQASFCVGLARAAHAAAPVPSGVASSLAAERDDIHGESRRLTAVLLDLADRIDDGHPGPLNLYRRLRLDAALLAGAATRLELRLTGGRGYVATSSTARRVREALFLPIQSPTESELRWALSHSA